MKFHSNDWDVPAWSFRATPTTWDVLVEKDKKNVMEYDNDEWPEYLHWDRKSDTIKTEKEVGKQCYST
jgi:hypothetical protein